MFGRLRSSSDAPTMTATSHSKKDEISKKNSTSSISSSGQLSSSSHSSSSSSSKHHHNQQQQMDDLLTCPVCLEEYLLDNSGTREPVFLQCHHSICRICLPKLMKTYSNQQGRYSSQNKDTGELLCPECRMVTVVPSSGLTQNFYLVSLIEARRKKVKEQERTSRRKGKDISRLRMWCRGCDSVALESCAGHQVTHLSIVLANTLDAYYNKRKHLTTVLQTRADSKGKEAKDVQDAVDQLDLATAALKRRLVARLDQATLSQATANSLLQEIEKMHRRIQADAKLREASKASGDNAGSGVDEGGSGGAAERKASYPGKADSSEIANVLLSNSLRETRFDLREEVDLISLDSQTSTPPKPVLVTSRASSPSSINSSPSSSSSSSTRTSPILTRQFSYDHLSCREQESRIQLLKEYLSSLDKMTLKQEDSTTTEKNAKAKAQAECLTGEALMEMFRRAVEVLEEGK